MTKYYFWGSMWVHFFVLYYTFYSFHIFYLPLTLQYTIEHYYIPAIVVDIGDTAMEKYKTL